ncbi:hypothetical protein [Mycoplasma suis]|uniref:Uncharacterized protein n=2 Tax=Mycoplasma suis TaxID=57372 RepID=F0QQV9_MYCSL|nr:hypothetical protein [Mycoplasma suis]ADX97879.1 hypothetical protein MSU_0337 [Mycoplasma suis str. Illinois]CBZ40379.1 hypothetical protein MSUIS_02860 [Mycoplasma suis KI3806]
MLKTLLAPLLLISTGAVGSWTITFFSKDQNRNKNSNNLTIYKELESGEILVGNHLQETVKTKNGNLKMIGNIDNNWKFVEAKDKKVSNNNFLFWLLGKDQADHWWNFFIEQNSDWFLEGQDRQKIGGRERWGEITKKEGVVGQEISKGNRSLEIYLEDVKCQDLIEEIKKKDKTKEYLENEKNSKGLTIKCVDRKPQI